MLMRPARASDASIGLWKLLLTMSLTLASDLFVVSKGVNLSNPDSASELSS